MEKKSGFYGGKIGVWLPVLFMLVGMLVSTIIGGGGLAADAVVEVRQREGAAEILQRERERGGVGAAAGGNQNALPANLRKARGHGFLDRRDHPSLISSARGGQSRPGTAGWPRAG